MSLPLHSVPIRTEAMPCTLLNRHFAERRSIARFLPMILVATALAAPGSTMAGPAAAQDCLYVLNQLGGSITVIRRSSNSVLTTIPNTECAGAAHCSPAALELTASTTSGYVTPQDASVVYVIDPLARRVVGTVPYPAQS